MFFNHETIIFYWERMLQYPQNHFDVQSVFPICKEGFSFYKVQSINDILKKGSPLEPKVVISTLFNQTWCSHLFPDVNVINLTHKKLCIHSMNRGLEVLVWWVLLKDYWPKHQNNSINSTSSPLSTKLVWQLSISQILVAYRVEITRIDI